MKKSWLFIAILIVGAVACSRFNADDERTAAHRIDSLEQAKAQLETEINNYFAEIETIEKNLDKIDEMERYISIQSTGENLNNNVSENINRKILLVSDILKCNSEKIDSLKRKLNNSVLKISGLEKMLRRLTAKNEELNLCIENLKQELLKRDELILQRDVAIKGLTNSLEELTDENAQKTQIIERQSETIHTAYYAFGTYRELKRQHILESNGLFASPKVLPKDFNRDYFLKIDTREVVEIPLYSHKVKIHTSHPKTSYSLVKQNDSYTLKIQNPTEFWEVSNYLVIEIE